MTMHDDEVAIDGRLVSRLLADQFPQASGLPIRAVTSTGTVNAVYRLGDRLVARLPRVERWSADLVRELRWLPGLSEHLTMPIPHPVFAGAATDYYGMPWAVYEWLDGTPYEDDAIDDEDDAARDLARFASELRRVDTASAPPAGRRPLRELDGGTRESILASAHAIDSSAAMRAWDAALDSPAWTGTPVWVHTDLLRPNLLAHRASLRAVIDWGGAGVGDPAADVIAAWSVFGSSGRRVFRTELGVDDETWNRARGYALHQAAAIIPYYEVTNPVFVATAVRTIREILSEPLG